MAKTNFNSFSFFRSYYHIPAGRKLWWALIRETVGGQTEIRLGMCLTGHPDLYLDVARRRFFSVIPAETGATVIREVFPAIRTVRKEVFRYTADNGLIREFPKNYVRDLYFTSVYSEELLAARLY